MVEMCRQTVPAFVPHVDRTHMCMHPAIHGDDGHECPCGYTWSGSAEGAPRLALDGTKDTAAAVRRLLEDSGIAVNVRSFIATGDYGVRIQLWGEFVFLEPAEAAQLAELLVHDAQEAMHASRADRRG